MQQQENTPRNTPEEATGRMGEEQQQSLGKRESELESGPIVEGVSQDDDEDKDSKKEGIFAPDETEVGMDKEDYRDEVAPGDKQNIEDVGKDRSDRRL